MNQSFWHFSRTERCFHTIHEPPSPSLLLLCLSLSLWLCGIELLIRIVARPNEFKPSSFCNGAADSADPKLWALILLSSVWWKNHLAAIQRCHSLTKPRKGDRHNGQFYYVFFFSCLFFFFSFDGMHMHMNHSVTTNVCTQYVWQEKYHIWTFFSLFSSQ